MSDSRRIALEGLREAARNYAAADLCVHKYPHVAHFNLARKIAYWRWMEAVRAFRKVQP